MILKVNLYLETDLKMSPEGVRIAVDRLQQQITQDILTLQDGEPLKYAIGANATRTSFKLLTRQEVEARLIPPGKTSKNNFTSPKTSSPSGKITRGSLWEEAES